MNEPFRLRYASQIVGLFLLAILLIVFLILLLRASRYFTAHDLYWIEMTQDEVAYLQRNADVMILGQRAGQVESIRYIEKSDKIRVNLNIDPRYSPDILIDSVVAVERKLGIGAPVLIIRRAAGREGAMIPLPPGSQIVSVQAEVDRLDKMAEEAAVVSDSARKIQMQMDPTLKSIEHAGNRFQDSLDTAVDPAMVKFRSASESFQETNQVVRPQTLQTLQAMQSATENLDHRITALTQKMEQLVENDMRQTLAGIDRSASDVGDSARTIKATSQDINQDVNETLLVLRAAATQVQQLASDTNELVRILRAEAEDLPGTTGKVNDTLDDTQDLVDEIRSHWLLRRYSKRPSSTTPISPSTLRGGTAR